MESRAQVANKFSQKLEITVIVTPARRAIDEKTGVQLMSDYQTLSMQLDGRYHKKGFCVVVSQIDEIDCDVFLKGDARAKDDPGFNAAIQQIKSLTQRSAQLGAQLRSEITELTKIDAKITKANIKAAGLIPTGRGSGEIKKCMCGLCQTSEFLLRCLSELT